MTARGEPLYYWDTCSWSSCWAPSGRRGEPAHDELLFIVVHQAFELWFKQILFELAVLEVMAAATVPEKEMGQVVARLGRITEPFATFTERLHRAAARGGHDLVFFSHVHFNSGFVVTDLEAVAAAVPADEFVVDGYHGFMAVPTDLAPIADRAFYLAGGYKYAIAGEGVCFLHCPSGYGERPVNTGWFAGSAELAEPPGQVSYPPDAARFRGATFDSTGLYRFNAVQRLLDELGLSVAAIHAHVHQLQRYFLDQLDSLDLPGLGSASLVPPPEMGERGHFLTFRLPDADAVAARLRARKVITAYRDDRLRFGFGIYHDESDVDVLCQRLSSVQRGVHA